VQVKAFLSNEARIIGGCVCAGFEYIMENNLQNEESPDLHKTDQGWEVQGY